MQLKDIYAVSTAIRISSRWTAVQTWRAWQCTRPRHYPIQRDLPLTAPPYRRALVIKLQHHGDVLLTSPVISTLAAAGVEVDALVFEETKPMLAGHPALSRLFGITRKGHKAYGLLGWLRAEWQLLRALRAREYDLVVHLTKRRRGAWLVRLLRPRVSVAPDALPDRFWRKSFTHRYFELQGERHMIEVHLDAVRHIGVQPTAASRRLTLALEPETVASVRALLAEAGLAPGGYIHVHPTSRWMFKAWSAEKMAAVIDTLTAAGEQVVLSASPSADEMAMIHAINARLQRPVLDLSGKLTLKQLGALIADAKLWFGLDSAPMHMAAALGTPTVAIFGPTGECKWRPWHVPHRIVAAPEYLCRPCFRAGCGDGLVSDCLESLPVEAALRAIRELGEEVGRPIALSPAVIRLMPRSDC